MSNDTIVYIQPVESVGTIIIDGPENVTTVVISTEATTVVLSESDLTIIGPDIPGPPGPEGPPGPSGGSAFTRIAAQTLSGHRVVKTVGGNEVNYASNDQSLDANFIEGITTGAASGDTEIAVQDSGEMTEGSWSWDLGPIYCGLNGQLTQAPTAGAWIRQVATAIDPTTIIVALQPPIFTP